MTSRRGASTRPSALHRTVRVIPLGVAATLLLAPLVAVTLLTHHLVLASSFASSAAVALHHPRSYRAQQSRIMRWYLSAVALSVAGSAAGTAFGVPAVVSAAVCAVIVLAGPAGRTHPPTVCVPFAVPVDAGFSATAWLYVAVAAVYLLLALAALTMGRGMQRPRIEHDGLLNGPAH